MPETTAAPVELRASGKRFTSWTTVAVSLSITNASGSFSFSVSQSNPEDVAAREIQLGAECSVAIHGEIVITGYIDRRVPSYDANSHAILVAGRDRTSDLVDCSAVHVPGEWHGAGMLRIAQALAAPFDVGVRSEVSLGEPFTRWRVQESETAFASIERMARHRGVLVTTDGLGMLILTEAGAGSRVAAPLVLGSNVLAGSVEYSTRDRFSVYTVKGQRAGSDFDFAEPVTSPFARATDPGVGRYRPRTIIAEAQADPSTLGIRARLEANRRSANGRTATITVRDWRDDEGALWRPNTFVHVRDEFLEIDRRLLIAGVTYLKDSGGTRAELDLAPREAFGVQAIPESGSDSLWTTSETSED
jgi:prophage tail gpP-like protein